MPISDSSSQSASEMEEGFYASHCNQPIRKLLIITSSGGGGLLQAANAKEQEAKAKDPNVSIIRQDLLRDWMGKRIGDYSANRWNQAQLKGDVADQAWCAWAQLTIAEYLFWPHIFFSALYTLFKHDIDEIIDTQCIGTSAILLALRIYNWQTKKRVRLQKILVDLPTKKATHFFSPIKKLSKKSRSLLQLVAIPPLLEEGQTAEEFWQTNCNLSAKEVQCGDVCVRMAFRKFQNKVRSPEPMNLKIKFKNAEELLLMKKSFSRGTVEADIGENEIHFRIQPNDRMVTLLLGSNPAYEATFNYMKNFIPVARQTKSITHFFVFCANHQEGEESLMRAVSEYVEKVKDFPKHLSIIPFSFQNEEVIAPLFFRSDATCTRSGGQTAMELMCVSQGEIWIHSETKKNGKKDLTEEELLQGIPGWESESAVYLQKNCGAKIITPETFDSFALDFFRANEPQERSNRQLASGA